MGKTTNRFRAVEQRGSDKKEGAFAIVTISIL